MTEAQVKSATEKFDKDGDVQRAITQLKTVYNAVMGAPQSELPKVPEFMTREKTLEILKLTMDILREKAEKISAELEGKGFDRKKDAAKFQRQFQLQ